MPEKLQFAFRVFIAIGFLLAGTAHFIWSASVVRIVPPILPHPLLLVRISGVCEIAGALGMMIPASRKPASWGLIALLIAVFPANVYMAIAPEHFSDLKVPTWALWLRLPLQAVLIAMVWWAGQKSKSAELMPMV